MYIHIDPAFFVVYAACGCLLFIIRWYLFRKKEMKYYHSKRDEFTKNYRLRVTDDLPVFLVLPWSKIVENDERLRVPIIKDHLIKIVLNVTLWPLALMEILIKLAIDPMEKALSRHVKSFREDKALLEKDKRDVLP